MIKINNYISKEIYEELFQVIPVKYQDMASDLLDFLCNTLNISIAEVVTNISGKRRYLLFIPSANTVIDICHGNLVSFFNGSIPKEKVSNYFTQTDDEEYNKQISNYFYAKDLWRTLSDQIAYSFYKGKEEISYYSIKEILKIRGARSYFDRKFISKLTDSSYYIKQGYLTPGSIVESCHVVNFLFGITNREVGEDLNYDEYHGYCLCVDNDFTEGGVPYVYVYTNEQFVKSVALSNNGKILRTICEYDLSLIDDEELRYIFSGFRWVDLKVTFNGERKKNTNNDNSSIKEQDNPLCFHGLYKYDKKESQKEGLQVWRRVKGSIFVPYTKERLVNTK